ncbi:MAG: energy transducer TonB, partial [Nitrospinota bacterium]
ISPEDKVSSDIYGKGTQFSGGFNIPQQVQGTDESGNTLAMLSPPETRISSGTIDFPYPWYLIIIKNKIDSKWSRLNIELLSGEIKRAVIKFKVLKSGKIEGAEVEESSGFTLFDSNALRAIVFSNPLPPIPKGFIEDSLLIHFEFEYKKDG